MNQVIRSFVIRRAETGDELAHVHVTQEANGCAVWYQDRSHDPRLLTWHNFSPRLDTVGVIAAAQIQGRRIAHDAINHGEQFAALLRFEQQ